MIRQLSVILLLGLCLAACQPGQYQGLAGATAAVPLVTPGPLTKTVQFWDLGLSMKYPDNWSDPQFVSTQVTLAQTTQAAQGKSITEPVVALGIHSESQLGLTSDASLQAIAAALSTGPGVALSNQQSIHFAGLDAAYMDIKDTNNSLYGAVFTFRMPDGRLGSLLSVAPYDQWADFAPALNTMQASAALLKPTDFKVPALSGSTGDFAPGGVAFTLPQGWTGQQIGSNGTVIYRSSTDVDYLDNSGFANGPQLVIIGQSLSKGQTVRSAMTAMIASVPGDVISDIKVGNQTGTQILSTDAATGQVVIFVGFTSQDKQVLMVLRWTAPGILANVTRPMLDSILASVRFGPVTSTIPLPAAPVSTVGPTATGSH